MGKRHYIIPIFVPHEGCPHDCVFCNQGKITGENKEIILGPKYKQENKVNSDFVRKTIEEYIETIGEGDRVLEVSFFGGTFTAIDINKQSSQKKRRSHPLSFRGSVEYGLIGLWPHRYLQES